VAKKILIADDADVFRQLEEGLLRSYGYDFVHANNGAEAIKKALEERPDLVLLDVQMPIMDGIQVLAFLKKDERTKAIPVVIVTTIGRDKDEEIIKRGGADAFLTKPIQAARLTETVRSLLGEKVLRPR
jgi:two-component system cell cycle response regulator DivK